MGPAAKLAVTSLLAGDADAGPRDRSESFGGNWFPTVATNAINALIDARERPVNGKQNLGVRLPQHHCDVDLVVAVGPIRRVAVACVVVW